MEVSELYKVVVIFRGYDSEVVRPAVDCLMEAGFAAFEVTADSPGHMTTLSKLTQVHSSDVALGLGTVRRTDQIEEAADAGCGFVISPHCDPTLIDTAHKHDMLAIPGAFTPSEIQHAWSLGADVVKLFPVAPLGAAYVRQLRAPLREIPLMATGGTVAEVAKECVAAGCEYIGVGANLIDGDALEARDWKRFTRSAALYLSKVTAQ
jgi:2-dehydro-3-deoxyphosphogluconate aldolase / (4S)-4-hydroxy-2-oxoglutarate aldolase